MKISNVPLAAQHSISNSDNIKAKLTLARTTDSPEIQRKLLESNSPRVLSALAENPHLSSDVIIELSELVEQYPAIALNLLKETNEE